MYWLTDVNCNWLRRCVLRAMFFAAAVIVSSAPFAARGQAEEPQSTTPAPSRPSDDDLRRSVWIAQGRTKFLSACSFCHGSKGDAGKVKSFTERSNWDPQAIHDVIVNGRVTGANVMPALGQSIPDDEVWRIVAYIKSLSTDFKGPIDPAAGK